MDTLDNKQMNTNSKNNTIQAFVITEFSYSNKALSPGLEEYNLRIFESPRYKINDEDELNINIDMKVVEDGDAPPTDVLFLLSTISNFGSIDTGLDFKENQDLLKPYVIRSINKNGCLILY